MIALLAAALAQPPHTLDRVGPVWEVTASVRLEAAIAIDDADPLLHPSPGAAAAAAPSPPIPGADLLALDTRAADDAILVGLARRPERHTLLVDLLTAARAEAPDGPAVAWLATAVQLGGSPLDGLPLSPAIVEVASRDAAAFRQQPDAQPIGPFADAPDLRDLFARDRWLGRPLDPSVDRAMRQVLAAQPELAARLTSERALVEPLFGPTERGLIASPTPIHGPRSERAAGAVPPREVDARPADAMADGTLAERRRWADTAWVRFDATPESARLTLGAGMRALLDERFASVGPSQRPTPVLRLAPETPDAGCALPIEPLPTHYARAAEVSRWAARQAFAEASGTRDALELLAMQQQGAAELSRLVLGLPTGGADPVETAVLLGLAAMWVSATTADLDDARTLAPIEITPSNRPKSWGPIGFRPVPVRYEGPGCARALDRSLIVVTHASFVTDKPLSWRDLRALPEGANRFGDVVAAHQAPPPAGCGCAPVRPAAGWLGLLALAWVRRRT